MSMEEKSAIDFFKCRQKKNLTEFINKVLYLAVSGSQYVHPDFRA